MKTGYKVAIGVVAGIGIGFLGFKIIMNKRKSDANERATIDVQKELLIDQVLILYKKENNESNRNFYASKTIEELQSLIDTQDEDITIDLYGDYGGYY
jgi:hypothetical protein